MLEATAALLREVSFSQLSLLMVAQRAGVGRPTVVRRWPSKASLVLDVIISYAPPEGVEPRGDAAEPRSYKERLRYVTVDVYRRLAGSSMLRAVPSLAAELIHDRELGREFRDRYAAPRRVEIGRLLEDAVNQGVLRADIDIWLMHNMLTGPVFAALFIDQAPITPAKMDELFDLAWSIISTDQPT